jgi:hypothetical protein
VVIVGVSFLFCAWFTTKVANWIVMTDELQRVKLGLNAARGSLLPTVHGEPYGTFPDLYALLTAPAYGLLAMPSAFRAVEVLNAGLMASTAIPAYLLARAVVPGRLPAYFVAALTVAVPWMAMSTMLMTEVVAYPAFVWAAVAMHRAIAEPSVRHDLLALVALVVAFSARTQFVALIPAFFAAVVVHEALYAARVREGRTLHAALGAGLRRSTSVHPVPAAAVAAAGLLCAVLLLTGSFARLLGNYAVTATEGELLPPGLGELMAAQGGVLAVGVGIVPVVVSLAWMASVLVRPADRASHAFAVLTAIIVGILSAEVASFALRFGGAAVRDRYLFYLAPLAFVAMAAGLFGRHLGLRTLVPAAVLVALLGTVPEYVPNSAPLFDSPISAFNAVLQGRSQWLGAIVGYGGLTFSKLLLVVTMAVPVVLAVSQRWLGRRAASVGAAAIVLVFCALETGYTFSKVVYAVPRSAGQQPPLEGRDWVDRAVGNGAGVGLLPTAGVSWPLQRAWWDVEFWNKAVEHSYAYPGSYPYTPFPSRNLRLDKATGLLRPGGEDTYLVRHAEDVRFAPAGRYVERHDSGLELWAVARPYRAAWATGGLAQDGTVVGSPARLRIYGVPTGKGSRLARVDVALAAPPGNRRRYRVGTRAAALGADARRTVRLSACVPDGGHADVLIRTAGPAGEPPAGVRVVFVRVRTTQRACRAR